MRAKQHRGFKGPELEEGGLISDPCGQQVKFPVHCTSNGLESCLIVHNKPFFCLGFILYFGHYLKDGKNERKMVNPKVTPHYLPMLQSQRPTVNNDIVRYKMCSSPVLEKLPE